MILRTACLAALTALTLGELASAQMQTCCPPLPGRGPSPLLFVQFVGPPGSRVTLFQGRAPGAASFALPATVGLRPGYGYRVMLSGFPDRPGLTLFPSLTVHDSLYLPPRLNAASFPAIVAIDTDDIESIQNGTLVTKLLYLEHPDRAEPLATKPGEILQTNLETNANLWKEARERGRPMIFVHLGERVPTQDELIRQNIPGTILHPGEKVVGPPVAPPCLPSGPMLNNPKTGTRQPEEECFHDGGDRHCNAAVGKCGGLYGLDPEDTVAEYRDSKGRKDVTPSNQVCICVPRFLSLRKECPLVKAEGVLEVDLVQKVVRNIQMDRGIPIFQAFKYDRLRSYDGRLRPSENVNIKVPGQLVGLKVLEAQQVDLGLHEFLGTKKVETLTPIQKAKLLKQLALVKEFSGSKHVAVTDQVTVTAVTQGAKGLELIVATAETRDLTVCCHEAPAPPDKPLVLVKCADKEGAKIGDIITFSLRYSNVGGRPISDVAVSDSLSGRLEYVEGSTETDRPAVFTMQPNEVGSLILRWEIAGKLMPSQSGRIRFKAKVR